MTRAHVPRQVGRNGKCFADAPGNWAVDVYNMGTFWYESLYIGVPALYHAVGKDGAVTNLPLPSSWSAWSNCAIVCFEHLTGAASIL